MTFDCLYCAQIKLISESSLEHAVPQFLGGAQAPSHFRLHNVCRICNNRLGLHVDGAYAKSWFVTNALAEAARKYYSGPGQSQPFPLTCIGPINVPGLLHAENAVAENWLGPSGETIIWVRTGDDALYWYSGGNPIHRKHQSTAYFLPVTDDPIRLQMGVEAFVGGFKKTKARRIFGATVDGLPPGTAYPGFHLPTAEDDANVEAIRTAIRAGLIQGQLQINTKFDFRFVCKTALAIGFSLFGRSYLATAEAREARLGLWPVLSTRSNVRGSPTLFNNPQFAQVVGYEGAVVITVMRTGGAYVMAMTVDRSLPFIVALCSDALNSNLIDPEKGYSLLLFPQLQQCLELNTVDMLAHIMESTVNPDLAVIDKQRAAAVSFWKTLSR